MKKRRERIRHYRDSLWIASKLGGGIAYNIPEIVDGLAMVAKGFGWVLSDASLTQAAKKFFVALDKDDPERLKKAGEDLVGILQALQLHFGMINAQKSLVGFVRQLHDQEHEVVTRLKDVKHLGVLAKLSIGKATRFDYTVLICQVLLDLKKKHSGMGLGSTVNGVGHKGKDITALEMAQAWAVFLNNGHLWGTFATERAVQYRVTHSSEFRYDLLNAIHPDLRARCEEIIGSNNLPRFHYVLAAYRLTKGAPCPARTTLIGCAKCLFDAISGDEDERLSRTYWAFRKARQIAYNRMHALLSLGTNFQESQYKNFVSMLRPLDGVGYSRTDDSNSRAVRLLDAIDSFQDEAVFSGPEAAGSVLSHLREFNRWWDNSSGDHFERLDRLFSRPADWPQIESRVMEHALRLYLPPLGYGWVGEVDLWRDEECWQDSNFLVSPDRATGGVNVDIYCTGGVLDDRTVLHVAQRLASHTVSSWNSAETEAPMRLWRSNAVFVNRMLSEVLVPGKKIVINPVRTSRDVDAYASLASSLTLLRNHVQALASSLNPCCRKDELSAILEATDSLIDADGVVWGIVLGEFQVLDGDTGKVNCEIDGVLAMFDETSTKWWFMERKDATRGSGAKQLKNMEQYFAVEFSEVVTKKALGGRTSLRTFRQSRLQWEPVQPGRLLSG